MPVKKFGIGLGERAATINIAVGEIAEFPEEVYTGMFEIYRDAHHERTEVPPEFHFAVLKGLIGSTLGKRVYIQESRPIYPNTYTLLVGRTGRTKKSHAAALGFDILEHADENVLTIDSVDSGPGLVQLFSLPKGCKLGMGIPNYGNEDFQPPHGGIASMGFDIDKIHEMLMYTEENEGFRIVGYVDEFARVLMKAKNAATATIPHMLQKLYDYPPKAENMAKGSPGSGPFPCFTMVGATTVDQFHQGMTSENINGGLANRIEYYVRAAKLERIAISKPGDKDLLTEVHKQFNQLRLRFKHHTPFTYTDEAEHFITSHLYNVICDEIESNEITPIVAAALSRTELQMKKNALIFSVIRDDNPVINYEDVGKAWELQKYLMSTVKNIYGNFAETIGRAEQNKVLDYLYKNRDKQSVRTINRLVHNYPSLDEVTVQKIIDTMIISGGIQKDGLSKNGLQYYKLNPNVYSENKPPSQYSTTSQEDTPF